MLQQVSRYIDARGLTHIEHILICPNCNHQIQEINKQYKVR